MDSVDPSSSFEIIDQSSDAEPGSMVTDKCDHDCNTRTSEEVTFSPAAISRDIEKNLGAGQAGSLDHSSYFLLGSMHIVDENGTSIEATSTGPVLNGTPNYPKAFQHHGVHRNFLQFEDASTTVINPPAQSPSNTVGMKSPLETPCTPVKERETENPQPLYPRIMNNTVNIPKPSGIGLHLNSIVNVLQAGSSAVVHVKSARNCNFNIRGKKSMQTRDSLISDRSKDSTVFTLPENVSECADDTGPKTHTSAVVKSDTSLSTVIMKSSNNPIDDQSAEGNKIVCTNIESDGILEELKSNSTKKRKRSSDSGDGCKRCHCRRSKCLKLYCDCFAAGLYCAGSCACQECYNRPEYEDTVLESRRQIESRNPLAFAPKIVKPVVEPPASSYGEDESRFTPSLARHKRGCNCKKSMCLKKYCECYHANVGCSDGCRCEGCKNVHGQKGEYSSDKDLLSKNDTAERTEASFIEMMQSGDGGLCHSELTPRTPGVQFKKDFPEGGLRPKQSFQSPESKATFVTPNVMTPVSPRNSDNSTMISEADAEVLYYGNTANSPGVLDSEERANHSKAQSFTGTNHYSSAGSLSWLRSPGTPLAQFSASRSLKAVDLDDELSNTWQDDTPDILKDIPAPLNAVKSSSPNKKRVSPPHASQHELGLRSLNGLRSGRKFILRAVPSAPPPLVPGVDSKSVEPGGTDSPPQGCSRNK